MSALQTLETKLDELLRVKAPFQLPDKTRKTIVEYLPWVNIAVGLLAFWVAWALWQWAHPSTAFVNYATSLSPAYGKSLIHHLTLGLWLGIISLIAEGVLLFAAFRGTRNRQKNGWNLLFYAALLNIAYSLAILLSDYGSSGRLLLTLLTSGAGLYVLFQIRSYYLGRRTSLSD